VASIPITAASASCSAHSPLPAHASASWQRPSASRTAASTVQRNQHDTKEDQRTTSGKHGEGGRELVRQHYGTTQQRYASAPGVTDGDWGCINPAVGNRLISNAEYVETKKGTKYVSTIFSTTRGVTWPLNTTSSWLMRNRIVPTAAETASARRKTGV
jgi:hypothetical protein